MNSEDMNIEELRREWNAMDEPVVRLPDATLLAGVKARALELETTIRRRDRRETVAAVLVAVFFMLPLITGQWLTRIGALIVIAACVLTVVQLRRARRAHPPAGYERPLAEVIETERSRLVSQIRLLQAVPWWYAAPFAVGVILVYAGTVGATLSTLLYSVVVVLVAAIIIALNRRVVENDLLPALRELDRLREQLQN